MLGLPRVDRHLAPVRHNNPTAFIEQAVYVVAMIRDDIEIEGLKPYFSPLQCIMHIGEPVRHQRQVAGRTIHKDDIEVRLEFDFGHLDRIDVLRDGRPGARRHSLAADLAEDLSIDDRNAIRQAPLHAVTGKGERLAEEHGFDFVGQRVWRTQREAVRFDRGIFRINNQRPRRADHIRAQARQDGKQGPRAVQRKRGRLDEVIGQ